MSAAVISFTPPISAGIPKDRVRCSGSLIPPRRGRIRPHTLTVSLVRPLPVLTRFSSSLDGSFSSPAAGVVKEVEEAEAEVDSEEFSVLIGTDVSELSGVSSV